MGFFNGLLGLLLFRSYCCHVDFLGSERHRSELEGYFREPCLCYIKPTPLITDQGSVPLANDYEYTTRYYHDSPDDILFESALPHHFIPHAIGLVIPKIAFYKSKLPKNIKQLKLKCRVFNDFLQVLMGFNIILYLIASVRI